MALIKIPDLYNRLNSLLSKPKLIPASIANHFKSYPEDILQTLTSTYVNSKTGNTFTIKAEKGDNEKEFKLYISDNTAMICRYRGNLEFNWIINDLWGYDYRISENFDTIINYTGTTMSRKWTKVKN